MRNVVPEAEELYNLGLACFSNNELTQALEFYRRSVELDSGHALAWNEMGVVLQILGRTAEAVDCFKQALELDSQSYLAFLNLGNALSLDRPGESEAAYRAALAIHPSYPDALNNLGVLLKMQGRPAEAVIAFNNAIAVAPNYVGAHYNLGSALQALDRADEAIDSFRKALELKPDYAQAYLNMGIAYGSSKLVGSHDEQRRFAEECYRKALEINPNYFEAYNNLGLALHLQGRSNEAIACYERAIELNPRLPEPYDNLGNLLKENDELDRAMSIFHGALEQKAANQGLKGSFAEELGGLLIELERMPIVYNAVEEIAKYRAHYEETLSKASQMVADRGCVIDLRETELLRRLMFRITNFYLAYQQEDIKDLLVSFSRLASYVLTPDIGEFLTARRWRDAGVSSEKIKIRIGLATEFLGNHNGSFWAYGWLEGLPKEDYELFFYSLNGVGDHVTAKFAALGTLRWLPFKYHNYVDSIKVIDDDNLDVLLLTDVGMGGASVVLSLTRLAPVQCAAWGHPVTTGSGNVDFYLSSELMETEDSDSFYSEKLIRLPNVGLNFEPPDMPSYAVPRSQFDLPEDKILYGSVQSLFKYLPQYDFVYPQIARAVPNALFVFVESKSDQVSARFKSRLRKSFDDAGVEFEQFVKILPRVPLPTFLELLVVLDINLDSMGWSGGITTMRSIAANLPVVTLPGKFMRGRHSYAMLKMIGVPELIAGCFEEYVSIAVRLGLDQPYRMSLTEKIKQQKKSLFQDMECVRELDELLKRETKSARGKLSRSVVVDSIPPG